MNSSFPTGDFLVEASSPTSAGNLEVMLKMIMTEEIKHAKGTKDIYPILEEFLAQTDAGYSQVFFLPFLYGSNVHQDAKASFIGLTTTTTKSEMIRSVYEGITFAHKQHIEKLMVSLGKRSDSVRLSGGAANSSQWCQMF